MRVVSGEKAPTPNRAEDAPLALDDYMVLHDPPFLIRLAVQGLPGRLVIVDIRNYGVKVQPQNHQRWGLLMKSLLQAKAYSERSRQANGPSLQSTAAATAWAWWRLRHLRHSVYVHKHVEALALERQACVGGRCEAYRIGVKIPQVWHVDIRSCYGSVSAETALPCRIIRFGTGAPNLSSSLGRERVGWIYDCTVAMDEPLLPYIHEGLTVYPVGTFRGVFCGNELSAYGSAVHVRKVHRWACYEMDSVLSTFQMEVWEARRRAIAEGNVAGEAFYKALAVSIVGKFAQGGRHWAPAPDVPAEKPYGPWYDRKEDGTYDLMRAIGWRSQRMVDHGESADSCPAIAAWIYAEARVRLWHLVQIAGRENVFYVDTDALMVNRDGLENLQQFPKHGGADSAGCALLTGRPTCMCGASRTTCTAINVSRPVRPATRPQTFPAGGRRRGWTAGNVQTWCSWREWGGNAVANYDDSRRHG
jgi:hypothetical protein